MTAELNKSLEYWSDPSVESMYDKHLLNLEVAMIRRQLKPGSKLLDAGCGEGEGTLQYCGVEGISIVGADFSEQRLAMAEERLSQKKNVKLQKIDFMGDYQLDSDFDVVVSQRFLINLLDFELQKTVIEDFYCLLKPGGSLIMLEGSADGVAELNAVRSALGLGPIGVRWHNLFFRDAELSDFADSIGFTLAKKDGLGLYFLLTRGVRPCFSADLNWDSEFNAAAAALNQAEGLLNGARASRLRLWVFEKTA